jgi:hypothetical protein
VSVATGELTADLRYTIDRGALGASLAPAVR